MADEKPNTVAAQDFTSYSALASYGEHELMREMQSGNPDSLTVVFNRYHRLVLVTALRILRDPGEAEDLMQSVFFEIFRKAAQFNPARGTLSKWILQYAYHRSINRKNYLIARNFYVEFDQQPQYHEEGWTTKVIQPTQEAARLAKEALAVLNEQQRQVVELVFFAGLTLKEIAEQTKQTFVSVRHHYYRGLKCMRERLAGLPEMHGKEVDLVRFEEVANA